MRVRPLAGHLADDLALAVDGGQHVAAVPGDVQLHHPVAHPQPVAHGHQQVGEALARSGPRP